jgi:hypothetical protein
MSTFKNVPSQKSHDVKVKFISYLYPAVLLYQIAHLLALLYISSHNTSKGLLSEDRLGNMCAAKYPRK